MNFLTNWVPLDISRNCAAIWMFILCIQNVICTDTYILITSSTCGASYDMDVQKKIEVTHDGTNILYENPCSVEFTKTSNKQYLCIYGDDIKLDCDTSLEYHERFVKNYISPEVKMSCNISSIMHGEWCSSQYTDNVFVVIRKSSFLTSDVIEVRVYLKAVPEEDFSENTSSIILIVTFVPVVVVLMIACLLVIIKQKSRKASTQRSQNTFQTAAGTVDLQAASSMYISAQPPPYESIISEKH